jgi:hypothetical protein
MLIGAGVLVVVAVIVAVVLMKKKEKFEGTGQVIITGNSAAASILSDQMQVMNFVNYVHSIAPGMSVSFPPQVYNTVEPGFIGNIQIIIPGIKTMNYTFGNHEESKFWNNLTFVFGRLSSNNFKKVFTEARENRVL